MTRAYDISYLDDAMTSLGAMLDYAVNSCGEDMALFYARFLASGVADSFSRANPKYLGGMSGIELASLVASRTGRELPKEDGLIDIGSPEYWTGWTLAYLSWYLGMDFGTIQSRGLTVQSLRDRYPTLHEADLSKSVQFALKRLKETSGGNLLKRARKNARLTQRQLSSTAGIPLSVIRSYEQDKRSLENAETENVWRICQALGCRIEDIRTGW
ncbi:MAG: helix-turn-helix transcriptional regulator [Bacteroidales bacterium]|nr:helix-turn-helix transcriptional regulator [Bacteroidales bacterium]MBP5521268.1 helix-turn-helix transcriptional regulator [Bacteroidales bacterium]